MRSNWHFNPAAAFSAACKLRGPGDGVGAGDGGGDQGGGDGSTGDEGDDGTGERQARSSGDGDPLDDDDDGELDRDEFKDLESDPRVRRLLARNRRLSLRDRAFTPTIRTLRSMGIDIRQPDTVRTLINGGRPATDAGDGRSGRQPAADVDPNDVPLPTDLEFKFDPSDLASAGWDLNDPMNRPLINRFRAQAEENHGLRMDLHRLVNVMRSFGKEMEQGKTQTRKQQQAAEGRTWREAVDTAAAGLPAHLREEFSYAVFGRVAQARATGRRLDPRVVTQQAIRNFQRSGQLTPGQAAKASGAAQRIAERNRSNPRAASLSGRGAPGSPTIDRANETLRDIHKRVLGPGYVGHLRR